MVTASQNGDLEQHALAALFSSVRVHNVHNTERIAEVCTGSRKKSLTSIEHSSPSTTTCSLIKDRVADQQQGQMQHMQDVQFCQSAGAAEEVGAVSAVAHCHKGIFVSCNTLKHA